MMIRHPAAQRLTQLLGGSLNPVICQDSELGWIGLAGDQSLDHRPPAPADNVGDDRVELDVGALQRLLQPLDMTGLLPDQLLAGAQQLTQFLDLLIRNKTAANQAVGQQVGDPRRIADIRLPTGNILDVSGIRQNQFEIAVAQNVPDRLPVKRRSPPWPHGCNPARSATPARAAARTSWSRRS